MGIDDKRGMRGGTSRHPDEVGLAPNEDEGSKRPIHLQEAREVVPMSSITRMDGESSRKEDEEQCHRQHYEKGI